MNRQQPQIRFVRVTAANWREVIALRVSNHQQNFVPPVFSSLATAFMGGSEIYSHPYGIYAGLELVGFFVCAFKPEDPTTCYWSGFLIDHRCQGRGLGRLALNQLLENLPAHYRGCSAVIADVHPDNTAAINLYHQAGFRETGDRSHGDYPIIRCDLKGQSNTREIRTKGDSHEQSREQTNREPMAT